MTWAEVPVVHNVDTDDAATESVNFAPIKLAPRLDPHEVAVRLNTATGAAEILSNRKARELVLERVENKGVHEYPNWRRIAMAERRAGAHDRIGLDFRILSGVAEALNATADLSFGVHTSDPIHVAWRGKGCADIQSVLMPTRL